MNELTGTFVLRGQGSHRRGASEVALAARLDDMYGLSGKRYRRSSSRTAAANAADGGRCGESSAVAGWEEAAAIGMWRMEQWQHCGPALSRTAHRPRSLR